MKVPLTAESLEENCSTASMAKLMTILRRHNDDIIISLKQILDLANPPQVMVKMLVALLARATWGVHER